MDLTKLDDFEPTEITN